MTTIVTMPRQIRSARVQPGTLEDNVIDVVFTTGADVMRCDPYDGIYVERLETASDNVRLERLNLGASFLDTHDDSQLSAIIGAVVPGSARMEDGLGICKVRLSSSTRAADSVADIKAGIISNISVGYAVHAMTRIEATSSSPAIMIATDWEPVEISAVPVPADPGAQIRMAVRSLGGIEVTECTIQNYFREAAVANTRDDDTDEMKRDAEITPAETVKEERADDTSKDDAKDDAADKSDADDKDDKKDKEERALELRRSTELAVKKALEVDRKRQSEIMSVAKRYAVIPNLEEIAMSAIEDGTSSVDFRLSVLERLAPIVNKGGPIAATTTVSEPSLAEVRKEKDLSFARNFFASKTK